MTNCGQRLESRSRSFLATGITQLLQGATNATLERGRCRLRSFNQYITLRAVAAFVHSIDQIDDAPTGRTEL
jgi:hypothetical protein